MYAYVVEADGSIIRGKGHVKLSRSTYTCEM